MQLALSARDVFRVWPEALQAAGILIGWALLTWGIAALLVWQVWPISGGLLLLSGAGWRPMTNIFVEGIYELKVGRDKRGGR